MKRILFFWLLSLLIIISGCAQNEVHTKKDGELYTSFLPPKTAEMRTTFSVDASNIIMVKSVETVVNDDLETVLIITYDWTNNSNAPQAIGENINLSVKQSGVSLTPDLRMIDDKTPLVTQIGPGETLENIKQGFIANSTDEIHISFKGKEKIVFIDGRPEKAYPVDMIVDFPSDT
jgi:hypothetical protein